MKFYNDGEVWFLGESIYPAGVCHCQFNTDRTQVEISLINGKTLLPFRNVSDFQKANGSAYSNYSDFITGTKGFFAISSGSGGSSNTGGSPVSHWVFDYTNLIQTTTTDLWSYYLGGSGGTLVGTVYIVYTDTTKEIVDNITYTQV